MTTMYEVEVECCVCGEKSKHMCIGSTNSHGSPDLDTRPPEMQRSTIHHLIQRCPSCGYCSSAISKCGDNISKTVESEEYQNIINNKTIPIVATSFLALSYEKQQLREYSDSAWRAIHAAWICDDKNNYEAAVECRKKAIAMIACADAHSQQIADQTGASEAITIDLMRRAGMFQQALKLAESTKKTNNVDEVILQVINYQQTLIGLNDIEPHRISDVLGGK